MSAHVLRQPRQVPVIAVREIREGEAKLQMRVGGRCLSGRQLEILQAIADGARNDELAAKLGISMPGVQKYVGQIMDLTGTTSRAAAVAFALRSRLIK